MARASRLVCGLGVVCLFLAGCSEQSWKQFWTTALFVDAAADGEVYVGPVDAVAASLQDSMNRLGLAVAMTRDAAAVKLRGTTQAGRSFTVVLTQEQNGGTVLTRMRIEWDNGRDDDMHQKIVASVQAQKAS